MENVRLCPEGVIAVSAVFVTIVDVTCQDIGDDSSVLARAAGFSVADVGHSGGRVVGPLRDRQTDTRIDRFMNSHRPSLRAKCHHQDHRNCHRCSER